jgi:hypothetical protein
MSISTYCGVFLLMKIRRCYHIKVNGEQCGSPALRGKCYCFFHNKYRHLGAYGVPQRGQRAAAAGRFPILEDANSVQAALMQVVRLILAQQIDSKEAGLLLYALQIASSNLQHLRLEPLHYSVVVDPLLVNHSRIGSYPIRHEQFTVETEEEQKERDELEHQIEESQDQADAEWEAELRQELEPAANAKAEADAEKGGASAPPRRPPTGAREQAMKLFDAGAALTEHPGDPEYLRAYQAARAEAEKAAKEASKT